MNYEIANHWAIALFNLTASDHEMSARKSILLELANVLKKNHRFARFISDPLINIQEKKILFQKITSDSQLINFLLLLVKKGKFKYLYEIARKYHSLVMENKKLVEATWITALPGHKDLKNKLVEYLESKFGKKFIIHEKISPEILGGAILIFDHKIFDFSIQGRLNKMKKTLIGSYG